jgi:ribosomal protein L12E/L44/L45/RPP1/RPP2
VTDTAAAQVVMATTKTIVIKPCATDIWAFAATGLQLYAGARTWPCGAGERAGIAFECYRERSTGMTEWTAFDVRGWVTAHPYLSLRAKHALTTTFTGITGSELLSLTADELAIQCTLLPEIDRIAIGDAVTVAAGVRRSAARPVEAILEACLRGEAKRRPQRVATILYALREDPATRRKNAFLSTLNTNDMHRVLVQKQTAATAEARADNVVREESAENGHPEEEEEEEEVIKSGHALGLGTKDIRGYTRGREKKPNQRRRQWLATTNDMDDDDDRSSGGVQSLETAEMAAAPTMAPVPLSTASGPLNQTVVENEATAMTLTTIGNVLYQNGDGQGAASAYSEALSSATISNSQQAILHYNLGHCQQDAGLHMPAPSLATARRCPATATIWERSSTSGWR